MLNCEIVWSSGASTDLKRLHAFLLEKSVDAAINASEGIAAATHKLRSFPRLGERMLEFSEQEVRRIYSRQYEIRYSVIQSRGSTIIVILRIWHTRELRH
ncbi:type II toxin-antitoxin system RelE/ParE family toxin [Limnobacter alexandrii]|jgi:plasmid stabilization system protein ParE|uniref:type II toxin-antitoxin system RelE/ParE family toxin n=1 Tax=Limnobacter alexandrii TaxID=2570352 RepID=UPI001108F855|nr:type II toxin-antitoxin system RelE/ParE family toxin [Limnobacter alexandrii]